jgi:hypothetical protein
MAPQKNTRRKSSVVDLSVSQTAPTGMTCGEILDPIEVGKRLKIPAKNDSEMTSKVYELTRKRAARPLPSFKVGKLIRFCWTRVEEWIIEGQRAA